MNIFTINLNRSIEAEKLKMVFCSFLFVPVERFVHSVQYYPEVVFAIWMLLTEHIELHKMITSGYQFKFDI